MWRVSAAIWSVGSGILLGIAAAVAVAAGEVDSAVLSIPAIAVVIGLLGAWWWPGVRYEHWTYRLDHDALELESGAIFRTRSMIPYFRVQHVDTSQGPIERRLGLSNLKVHTASAATDARLPGLASRDATEIRRIVLERAGIGDAV